MAYDTLNTKNFLIGCTALTVSVIAAATVITVGSLAALENNRAQDALTNESRLACIEAGNQWINPNCVVIAVTP